jgi:hypothetical protein
MYVRHFLKMLLLLVVMGGIGIGGLALANYYSKSAAPAGNSTLPADSGTVKK